MILKSLSRKSGTGQLLKYLFKKEDKLVNGNQKPIIIRHNVRSRTLDKQIKEFKENDKFRLHKRKDSVKAYHTILSFSNKDKDKITEKTLRAVAKQYMQLRGKDNLFIGTVHFDNDHVHLHMVMSGTKYLTGQANRLSRAEFRELKQSLDKWQEKKFPELIHSLPRHGLNKATKEPVVDRHNSRVSQKETLLKTLEAGYTKSKSIDSFLTTLKSQGYDPYYRAGRLTGVRSEDGLKFRLGRLGYDKEKIAKLDEIHLKEEKALSELRDIREKKSEEREQETVRDSRDLEENDNEKDQDDIQTFRDDLEREDQENENEVEEIEDSDDREP
ncbi:MAG: relaxase/mobilization nuclease domain-containing protein [Chitinophagaceae bacterium]|nr:relaxase/mobilization nuclease domain-containing protein [Chitinophagaceae bacterium]